MRELASLIRPSPIPLPKGEGKKTMSNYLDLTSKVALVTGASSGIGAATAHVLARLGASVAFTYHNNQAGARTVQEEITQNGRKAIAIRADFRDADQIRAMVKHATEALGPIDILVNNAGSLVERQSVMEMTKELWNRSEEHT